MSVRVTATGELEPGGVASTAAFAVWFPDSAGAAIASTTVALVAGGDEVNFWLQFLVTVRNVRAGNIFDAECNGVITLDGDQAEPNYSPGPSLSVGLSFAQPVLIDIRITLNGAGIVFDQAVIEFLRSVGPPPGSSSSSASSSSSSSAS